MAEQTRKCFYEVLGVERTANEAELKVAYRKLALKWHPDKNLDNPDATAIFQEIQSAYAVLSDAQERAWYDSHRDEILRGGDGQGGAEDPDAYVVNVWPFFSGSAYSGYGDGEGGFYQVYRDLFEKVDRREQEESERETAPSFGSSESSWEEVSLFYAHWSNFVSRLSFGWADEYREQDAPSRHIRRAMEKENKKARDAAKRKYQETIRALVEFMRKRDKRVIKHQVEAQRVEAERARQEAEAAKVRAEEYKKERAQWLKQQQQLWEEEEAQRVESERAGGSVAYRLADESDDDDDNDDDDRRGGKRGKKGRGKGKGKGRGGGGGEAVIYECVICGNTFKSEKQKANHEKSRAHRKMVESLKEEFGDDMMLDELEPGEGEEEEGAGEGGAAEAAVAAGGEGEERPDDAPGAVAEASAATTEGPKAAEQEGGEADPPQPATQEEAENGSDDDDDDDSEEDLARMNRFAQGFRSMAVESSDDDDDDDDDEEEEG